MNRREFGLVAAGVGAGLVLSKALENLDLFSGLSGKDDIISLTIKKE